MHDFECRCSLIIPGRFSERARYGGELRIEGTDVGRYLDGGQDLLLGGQFGKTATGVGDRLSGLCQVHEPDVGKPGLQLGQLAGAAIELAHLLFGGVDVGSEGLLQRFAPGLSVAGETVGA